MAELFCKLATAYKVIMRAAKNVRTQDNRATGNPIFMVQEERYVYVEDEEIDTPARYWYNKQPFFTEKAAQEYIDANRHNLSHPRIYVESAYRNKEWIAIRKMLANADLGE